MEISIEKYVELTKLCRDVAKFIDDNFSPYTEVVINVNDFTVKEDKVNGYFELTVKE